MSPEELSFLFKVGRWTLRRLPKQAGEIKNYLTRSLMTNLHVEVVHSIRKYGAHLDDSGLDNTVAQTAREAAVDVCTKAANLLSGLMGGESEAVSCCLKVFVAPEPELGVGLSVGTLARSRPDDGRFQDTASDIHPVDGNTVWCALLGKNDGHTDWSGGAIPAFSCGNLTKHQKLFACTRENWQDFYVSTLAFPIRYYDPRTSGGQACGFLAFDSPRAGAFQGLPDVFSYRDSAEQRSDYRKALRKHACFHVGAMVADMLGAATRSFYARDDSQAVPLR